MRLELRPAVEELSRLADAIETLVAASGLEPALAGRATVALDELVTNAIHHGRLPPGALILVELACEEAGLTATVTDPGPPFNPFAGPHAVDVTAPLADRPVGGLGLFLVHELAQELAYRREEGCNRLKLRFAG